MSDFRLEHCKSDAIGILLKLELNPWDFFTKSTNLKERERSGDKDVEGKIILKCILQKQDDRPWTGFTVQSRLLTKFTVQSILWTDITVQ